MISSSMPARLVRGRGALLAVAALAAACLLPLTSAAPAEGVAQGMFKVKCGFSHTNKDDPIVYPGKVGAAHQHEFSGARTTNYATTDATLAGSATTCSNLTDRSAYWAPTLLLDGRRVQPLSMQVYYRASNKNPALIKTIPRGLRMIAGSMMATAPQSSDVAGWTCGGNPPNFTGSMPTCGSGGKLRNRIRFPECWNGKTLDSADHKSHMSYLVNGSCPSTHPVAIPRVDIEVHYGSIPASASRVRLSSGSWTSLHGDFWNAWDPTTLQRFVTTCLNGQQICDTV
jgi:hypothetical protein